MGIAEFQDNIAILFINIPDHYRIDLTVPVIIQNLTTQFCRTFFNVLTFCDLIFVLTAFKFVDNVFEWDDRRGSAEALWAGMLYDRSCWQYWHR